MRFGFVNWTVLREPWYPVRGDFIQGQPGWDSIADRGSLEACAPEFWPFAGPSLVGMAIKTVGQALELLGPGGPEKKAF